MTKENSGIPQKHVPRFDPKYHSRQWDTCYESTRAFFRFLEANEVISPAEKTTIVDLCCGSGANLYWMKQQYPEIDLIGVDALPELVAFGNGKLQELGASGIQIIEGDVYALDNNSLPKTDGVIALQTVSWLPDEVGFVDTATSIDADWIAITGLMMPGKRSFRCLVNNEDKSADDVNYYNTFSIQYLEGLFNERGYGGFVVEPFHIGIDLEKPEDTGGATYTEKTEDGRRLQISGAVLMNWYFLLARRKQ